MNIIRNHSEKLLLADIEGIRQKKGHWWAVHIHLSQLKLLTNEVLGKMLEDTARYLSGYGEFSLYIIGTGDAILLSEYIPTVLSSKIVKEVSFIFEENPLARKSFTEEGRSLCSVYKTGEDLITLHHLAMDWQEYENSHTGPSTYKMNPNIFRQAAEQRDQQKRLCVLIAEDQRFSRQMVIEILSKEADILAASDGGEALKLYEVHAPDVVFLDIDMPLISGQDVLDRITMIDPESFVVMLTASHRQQDVEYALKHGAKGYIVKPFTRQKIDGYLNIYRQKFMRQGVRA